MWQSLRVTKRIRNPRIYLWPPWPFEPELDLEHQTSCAQHSHFSVCPCLVQSLIYPQAFLFLSAAVRTSCPLPTMVIRLRSRILLRGSYSFGRTQLSLQCFRIPGYSCTEWILCLKTIPSTYCHHHTCRITHYDRRKYWNMAEGTWRRIGGYGWRKSSP